MAVPDFSECGFRSSPDVRASPQAAFRCRFDPPVDNGGITKTSAALFASENPEPPTPGFALASLLSRPARDFRRRGSFERRERIAPLPG